MNSAHEISSGPDHKEKSSTDSSTDLPSLAQGTLSNDTLDFESRRTASTLRGVGVIVTLAGINFLNTMGSGILIAALPRIAKDLDLPDGLILW